MALYVATGKTLATAANTNVIELRAHATAQRARIREMLFFAETAVALNLAVFRTTAVGTAGTTVTPQSRNPADGPANSTVVTGPTGGTNAAVALERAFLPAVIGSAVVFGYNPDEPLVVPLAGSLMIRNDSGSAGPAITWKISWEE